MSGSGDKKQQHQALRPPYPRKGSPYGSQNHIAVYNNDFGSSSYAQQGNTNSFHDSNTQYGAPSTPRQSAEATNCAPQYTNQHAYAVPDYRNNDQARQGAQSVEQGPRVNFNGLIARDPTTPPDQSLYGFDSSLGAGDEQRGNDVPQHAEKDAGKIIPQTAKISMWGSPHWHGLIATLDTGTKLNWISAAIVQHLGMQPYEGVELAFETFNGQRMKSSATLNITWAIPGGTVSYVTNFRVVQDCPFDVLFGWNYLNEYPGRFNGTASPAAVLAQTKEKKDEKTEIEENRKRAQGESSEVNNSRNQAESSHSGDKKSSREKGRKKDKGRR